LHAAWTLRHLQRAADAEQEQPPTPGQDDPLIEALRQPVEDQGLRWRREQEEAEQRRATAKRERAARTLKARLTAGMEERMAAALGEERQAVIPVISEQLEDIHTELRALQAENLELRALIAAAERREAALHHTTSRLEIMVAELRSQADRSKAIDYRTR
jgi:chromosome segregation ATPase